MFLSEKVTNWLLEAENPSLRCRVLVELLSNSPDDLRVVECKGQIAESTPVKILLSKMHPEGYWLQRKPSTGKMVGDGTEYGAFGTTHYCLSYLAELGMDKSNVQVAKAADRYLDLQKTDGDFYGHYSCLLGLNIRTFTMLGYGGDPRVRKSIDLLLRTDRPDGGYLCDMHEGKYKTRPVKSCIRGSVKALLAFSHHPEYWNHSRVRRLVDYFLQRGGVFKRSNPEELVNKDLERVTYPITWRANMYEILLALSKMGYGNYPDLEKAWRLLDSKAEEDGRYVLDWTPQQSPWRVGEKNQPNKWVTFYVYLAHSLKEKT